MKITYKKEYNIFNNIYLNRNAGLKGEVVTKLNKLSLPHDKKFIKNVNKLREDLCAARTLSEFNIIRSQTNGHTAVLYTKKDHLELEYKVHIDYKHIKHFICMNDADCAYIIKEWNKDLTNITSILINNIHNHSKYRNKIKK